MKNNFKKIITNIFICLFLLVISICLLLYRQRIVDQFTIWQFVPTSDVVALTDRLKLTDEGIFVLYASQPELKSANDFNISCKNIENTTSILGCFSDNKVYIYNVIDDRLNGVREVTAAHEMLHAVYQRMSDSEKEYLSPLLESEYEKLSNDEAFVELIEFYERTEPGERYNELHSIIGTSVKNISSELEEYYSKYFKDRQAIVDNNEAYNKVFSDLHNRAKSLSDQLSVLNKNIPSESNNYNILVKSLNSDIELFNKKAESGDFTSWSEFYSDRSILISRSNELSITRSKINSDIDKYNTLLEEYNSVALESQKLYESIDSKLAETESL